MNAQKYLKLSIIGVIVIVVFFVGYGIYINEESRLHIDKMEAAKYTVLPVAYADYRDIPAVIPNVNVTARAPWTIDITAQYEGILRDIYVSPSQQVEEGMVLAVMENHDIQAQLAAAEADIEGARAQLLNAEQTVSRYAYLLEYNALSRQEYENAVAQRDASRAQLNNRIAQRELVGFEEEKMVISSPKAATIVQVYREAGKHVRAGEAIFMMADTSTLNGFSIMTHEDLKKLLSLGNQFILEISPHQLMNKVYPTNSTLPNTGLKLNQFIMTIVRAVPDLQAEAEFHEVYWEVENPSGILEPTYYDGAKILSKDTAHVLAVPSRGIQRDKKSGGFFVYTLDSESRLARRDVVCGIEGNNLTEIVSGIEKGEPIVIGDLSNCTVGMKVGASKYEF